MPSDIRSLLEKYRREFRDLLVARYVRPDGIGQHIVSIPPDGTEIAVPGPRETFAVNESVLVGSLSGDRSRRIIAPPPAGMAGGGAFASSPGEAADLDRLRLISFSPEIVPRGSVDFPVVIVGEGLSESPLDTFSAEVLDIPTQIRTPDPFATVHDAEWIADPEGEGIVLLDGQAAVRILVDLSILAPLYPAPYQFSIAVRRS